jgi:ABC-type dipeptide/oligopeptide/nickel transport system permease subunit
MKAARLAAMVFLGVVAISALIPRLWTPQSYAAQMRENPDAPPSRLFPLGTDALGRDRLARLLYGTRVSLLLAPAAALLSCAAAALIGGIAGLAGGWTERVVLASVDLFLSLPWLLLLMLVRACLPLNVSPVVSITITFLLLGLLGWPASARVVRAAVGRLRDADFMLQARAMGCSEGRLLARQLTPNVMPVLLAQFWTAVPLFLLAEATLGMLGLGVSEPLPSWGGILREIESGDVLSQPWIAAPVLLLAAVAGSFQLIMPREDYSI